ncbi:MAG: hypothetical protein AAF747_03825 [Planctomycetota bacterium]
MAKQRKRRTAKTGRKRITPGGAGIAAIAVAVVVVGIGLVMVSNAPDDAQADDGPPRDITGILSGADLSGGNTGGPGSGVVTGDGLRIESVDPNDPERVAMRIVAERADPDGSDRLRVTKPVAWIYAKNGSSVMVRSDSGTLVMPQGGTEPESGTLVGDVVIQQFPPMQGQPDPATDEAEMTLRTPWLAFDLLVSEVWTRDEDLVRVTAPGVEFAGSDLRMTVSEVREQIEVLRVERGEYLRLTEMPSGDAAQTPATTAGADQPAAVADAAASRAQPQAIDNAGDGEVVAIEAPVEIEEPIETFYRLTFEDEVLLNQGSRVMQGDRLTLFARLVDNELAPGAIAELSPAQRDAEPEPTPVESPRETSAAPATVATPDAPASTDQPMTLEDEAPTTFASAEPEPADSVELRWSGPMELRPLDTRPAELATDEVMGRMTAERSGLVLLADSVSSTEGRATAAEYYGTQARIILAGTAGRGVELAAPGQGVLRVGRLEYDLLADRAYVAGPGDLETADADANVAWDQSADFTFVRTAGDDGEQFELREAFCVGNAEAGRSGASIQAGSLRALFEPTPFADLPAMSRLIAIGDVRVDDGRAATGTTGRLDVEFESRADRSDPDPVAILATGNAEFEARGDRIRGDYISADLMRTADDDLTVTRLQASGEVEVVRQRDGTLIQGEQLAIDARAEWLEAESDDAARPAIVRRSGTEITGRWIGLDGAARSALVEGAGTFAHSTAASDDSLPTAIDAAWTLGMRYDDISGTLDAHGDVRFTHEVGSGRSLARRDAVQAETVRAEIAAASMSEGTGGTDPLTSGDGLGIASGLDDGPASDRPLQYFRAVAAGPDRPAVVETARFEVPTDDDAQAAELVRALRVSGPEIVTDEETGEIEVIGAGTMLVSDTRLDDSADASDDRGTGLFNWRDGFSFDRIDGRANMTGAVRLVHRRLRDGRLTQLEGDRVMAMIDSAASDMTIGASNGRERPSLRRARALGNVWMQSGSQEMLADEIDYDLGGQAATARADAGRRIVILDPTTSTTPLQADRASWNLATDRIRLTNPSSIGGSGAFEQRQNQRQNQRQQNRVETPAPVRDASTDQPQRQTQPASPQPVRTMPTPPQAPVPQPTTTEPDDDDDGFVPLAPN